MQKDGKILLTKSPKWSNKWLLPGGHIEAGESILEATVREAQEETGLKLKPIKILTFGELIDSKDFHRPAHFIYFDCIFDVIGGELKLQKDELTESRWLTPSEALKLELVETYPETLQKYIEFLSD
ncbi:MAG: NUDIX domain-containing protein [Parcubacteria group bacterium]|nr:NUDIX domain-containing protein [Parcubacteria group bacterium]